MTRTVTAVAGALTLAACAAAQESAPRNATIPLDGATRVEIRSRAGHLKVNGQPGRTDVIVRGTARASAARLLPGVRLVAERRGDVIHIEAVLPQPRARMFGISERWTALDLDIVIPAGTAVTAWDGSGPAELRGTGPLRVTDGSGSLLIEDIMGEVDVTDGSGELVIRNVTGPLNVRDGSGSMRIEGVGHGITIRDGSGDIVIRRVSNVHIVSDGSGNVDIADATGDVRIDRKGSGRVHVRDVGGDFTVLRGRASRIEHQNVQGSVSLPSR